MTIHTKLQLARTLIASVEGGSIAAGARVLNITRSAASKNIAALENALGIQLLFRNPKKLELTEAGSLYVREVAGALAKIEEIESEVSQFRDAPAGLLVIDSTILFGRLVLRNIIRDYLKRFPQMEIDLRLTDAFSGVALAEADLYFRSGPIRHQDMIARKIMDVRFRTIATPGYLDRCGVPRSFDDLKDHNCLNFRFAEDHTLFRWRFQDAGETVFRLFSGNFTASDVEELRYMVLQGLGVAQLPEPLISKDIQTGVLTELFPETVEPTNTVSMCYARSRKNDIKIKSFREFFLQAQ